MIVEPLSRVWTDVAGDADATARVAVTGGSGSLGSRIVRLLGSRGHPVTVIDVVQPKSRPGRDSFRRVDLLDVDMLRSALRGADAVIHTAALHGMHAPERKPEDFFRTNVIGTANLVSACIDNGIRRLVFTSSTSVYGASCESNGRSALWLDETAPVRCLDIYDQSKELGENLCRAACLFGTQVVVLRTARFFFDDPVGYNVRKLYRGVDVEDAARAHVRAAVVALNNSYDVFNVVARSPFQPDDVEMLARDAPVVIEHYFPGVTHLFAERGWSLPRVIDRVYDSSKAQRELGFAPERNFDEFLQELRSVRSDSDCPASR